MQFGGRKLFLLFLNLFYFFCEYSENVFKIKLEESDEEKNNFERIYGRSYRNQKMTEGIFCYGVKENDMGFLLYQSPKSYLNEICNVQGI